MRSRSFPIAAAPLVAATFVLSACGGGGGGGGGGFFLPPTAPAPPTAPTTITLSGTATYDFIPNPSGGLVYGSIAQKPVRGAVVEVLNAAGTVVVSGSTDGGGAYSLTVPASIDLRVRVRAQLAQSGSGATWDVTVRDNTQGEALYSMESGLFNSGAAALTRDVHAPSGWDGTRYASTRVAAPFAVLDTIYAAQAKLLSVAASTAFPPLRVFWSVNNLPASGDRTQGQIGTTSFVTNGTTGRSIYVLGRENVDTDEYDASVIAHEWGHYYQSAFSRDDSRGGPHSISERLDRRIAFSEGWGNAWSGIALERSNYTDALGIGQAQGTNLDLTVGPSTVPGWFRESSVHSILWQLNRRGGLKPLHDTLSGAFRSTRAVTSIHPFAAVYRSVAPGNSALLDGLLGGQNITVAATADPFGPGEINDGGLPLTLPLYRSATVGGGTVSPQPCVSNQFGDDNKHGSVTYLRFSAASARGYAISVTGPAGSDPDFVVYSAGERARSEALSNVESATIALPAGEAVLAIYDFNNSAAQTCFNVTIS